MSKIHCISYGTKEYKKALLLNIKTAIKCGADYACSFGPEDISRQYIEKNERFFSKKRGGGYWLWKPYLIDKCLSEIEFNDWLVYVDAGLFYLNSIRDFINILEQENFDFVMMPTVYKEYQYTKRDIFVYIDADNPQIYNTYQRQGGVLFIRKTAENIEFIKEWLEIIQVGNLVTDDANELGTENYEGFIENRHDQSIMSVLSKKKNIGVEMDLYDPAKLMWKSKKVLCYHHSMSGNKIVIWLESVVGPVVHRFKK